MLRSMDNYYLEDFGVLRQGLIASCDFSSMSNNQKIMLRHRMLGHPNLFYLKCLFPFKSSKEFRNILFSDLFMGWSFLL